MRDTLKVYFTHGKKIAPTGTAKYNGWSDNVIAPENSIRFAREADCSLHLISGDHRLNSSLDVATELLGQFMDTALSG